MTTDPNPKAEAAIPGIPGSANGKPLYDPSAPSAIEVEHIVKKYGDFIAVDEMPGLQLKGKSAETFRVLKVTAIREDSSSPWVPIPTDLAMTAYAAKRQLYTAQSVFA